MKCRQCLVALRQTLLERRLMRKRYLCNIRFFQDEIERLDMEIVTLQKKARRHCE